MSQQLPAEERPPGEQVSSAEYIAVRKAVGVLRRVDRVQLRMWGRDPVRMLNGLITNELTPGDTRVRYAGMLTPKGRMLADLRVITTPAESQNDLLLDLPVIAADGVREHLTKYVPPLFARWGESDRKVVGVYGPRSIAVVESVLGIPFDEEEDSLRWGSFRQQPVALVGTTEAGGEPGCDLFIADEQIEELQTELAAAASKQGGQEIAFAAFETLRIEAGRPRYGVDLTEDTLPAEVFESTGRMDRAVSFTKGCYTGQEVVVRIAHRGHVNRHLRGLLMGGADPPARNTAIVNSATGKEVGWTTSAARSPKMEQTISLCFLRREVSPGDDVLVGEAGTPAKVTELPFVPLQSLR